MSWIQAIVLGIVQGLGEFLPISSSAHLIVVPWMLGWKDHSLAFDVALHVGTLAAVLYAFLGDWITMIGSVWRCLRAGKPLAEEQAQQFWLIAIASVPAAVIGLLLEDTISTAFRSPALVAVTMAVMGAVLLVADHRAERRAPPRGHDRITFRDAMLIGTAQALALVPGVSRSGATITMALFLHYPRQRAARFSFLLATPITLGAALLKAPHMFVPGQMTEVLLGIVTAGIVGFLSIKVLLGYVKTSTYRPFVYYRWAFALLIVVLIVVRQG